LLASLLLNYQFNIVILLFLFNLDCVSRPKIYSVRSLMKLINVYKFTKETLARRSSFDRFNASLIIYCVFTYRSIFYLLLEKR